MRSSPRSSFRSSLAVVSLATISGCSFATHFEDFSTEAGPLTCASEVLAEGTTAIFTTTDGTNGWNTSCGGDTSPDVAFEFTAPTTTYYRVTTAGSAFDTVLAVREPVCDPSANEYVCNNDADSLPTSEVILPIAQDERVLIVVDGNASSGDGQLLVERVACPSEAVGLSSSVNHTTVARPNDHTGACGGGGGDHPYRFVPEVDGLYRFSAIKNATQTRVALYVDAGVECGGTSLGCNAGADGRSEVDRQLTAGVPVTVWVDALDAGSDGAYTLSVEPVADFDCTNLPMLSNSSPTMDTLAATDPHHLSTSCASTSVWWLGRTDPAEIRNFPDKSYSFDTIAVGAGCGGSCQVTVVAHFPFAAEVLTGSSCRGPVESCSAPAADMTDPLAPVWTQTLYVSGVFTGQDAHRQLIIDRILEDYQGGPPIPPLPQSDDVTITLMCFGIC